MATTTFWLSSTNEVATSDGVAWGTSPNFQTPVANVFDDEKSTVFRFPDGELGPGERSIQANWNFGRQIGVVALLRTNFVKGDRVRFIVWDDSIAVAYDVEVELANDPDLGFDADFVFVLPQNINCVLVQAFFNFAESPSRSFNEIGEFWCGPCFRPEHGISYEVTPILADPSEVSYSRGQQAIANTRARYRALNLQFPALKESEVFGTYGSTEPNLWDIYQRNGRTQKVLTGLVGDGDTFTPERNFLVNRTAIFGLMDADLQPQPFDASAGERVYSLSMTVRETR